MKKTTLLSIYMLCFCLSAVAGIRSVGLAEPDTLYVDLNEGEFEEGKIIPYERSDKDEIITSGDYKIVVKNKVQGLIIGRDQQSVRIFDKDLPMRISRNNLDDKSLWTVMINGKAVTPLSISRKSTVYDRGVVSLWNLRLSYRHQLFLKFDNKFKSGQLLRLKFKGFPEKALRVNFLRMVTPAIHFNQNGFHPKDKSKKAWLSLWTGKKQVDYSNFTKFQIINASGEVAGEKETVLISNDESPSDQLYELDFSDMALMPGQYRIYIPGLGVSAIFKVDNLVWEKAFQTAFKGITNSRAMALRGRFAYKKPESIPPDTPFIKSRMPFMATYRGLGNNPSSKGFEMTTGKTVYVEGGYSDERDEGRRITHLYGIWRLMNLYEQFPDYFGKVDLNITILSKTLDPKIYSRAGLPDMLKEAVYGLDYFRRLQSSGGGISGGVYLLKEKKKLTPVWLGVRKAYIYAPDPWSSYIYAAVAARATVILRKHNTALSELFSASAEKAWTWAEKERTKEVHGLGKLSGRMKDGIIKARVWAAAEIYRLSNQQLYAEIFKEHIPCSRKNAILTGSFRRAGWTWLMTKSSEEKLNSLVKNSLLESSLPQYLNLDTADYPAIRNAARETSLIPDLEALSLLESHAISNSRKVEKQIELGAGFILGANQVDTCFTLGLGRRNPRSLRYFDAVCSGQKKLPGITVYGLSSARQLDKLKNLFGSVWSELHDQNASRSIYPNRKSWPAAELFVDHEYVSACVGADFNNTIISAACLYGYLAAVRSGLTSKF